MPIARIEPIISATSSTSFGASPSDGSSSISSFGRAISARPIGEHLLLAAASTAGELVQRSPRRGKMP